MTVYVLGADLEPVQAVRCPTCDGWYPIEGLDNLFMHNVQEHSDSLIAAVIEATR